MKSMLFFVRDILRILRSSFCALLTFYLVNLLLNIVAYLYHLPSSYHWWWSEQGSEEAGAVAVWSALLLPGHWAPVSWSQQTVCDQMTVAIQRARCDGASHARTCDPRLTLLAMPSSSSSSNSSQAFVYAKWPHSQKTLNISLCQYIKHLSRRHDHTKKASCHQSVSLYLFLSTCFNYNNLEPELES